MKVVKLHLCMENVHFFDQVAVWKTTFKGHIEDSLIGARGIHEKVLITLFA